MTSVPGWATVALAGSDFRCNLAQSREAGGSCIFPLSDPEKEPHAACESTGMILAAESIPSPLQLMLVTPESGIGKPPPFFSRTPGTFGIRPGTGIGKSPVSRFGREPEIGPGVPGRRAGDFLVFPGVHRLSSL